MSKARSGAGTVPGTRRNPMWSALEPFQAHPVQLAHSALPVLTAHLALSILAGCSGPQSMFEAAGPEASRVLQLWWVLFGIAAFVVVSVIGILLFGTFRKGAGVGMESMEDPARLEGRLRYAMAAGIGITVVLLFVILAATFRYSGKGEDPGPAALTIEVVGKLWWWKIVYIGEDGKALFETANEIHIPAGVPVRLRLLSDNVIHSFWVPSLAGKVDLIPGRTNYLRLEAREPGEYRGQCAEYCGMQHTLMAFLVVAQPPDEFARWMADQQRPARDPEDSLAIRGRSVFLGSRCADCHTIRGVSLATEAGPDLTHLADRRTLAAATLPNRRGHLGGWIVDPQGIKPGNLMPSVPLESRDFLALLQYLESLE